MTLTRGHLWGSRERRCRLRPHSGRGSSTASVQTSRIKVAACAGRRRSAGRGGSAVHGQGCHRVVKLSARAQQGRFWGTITSRSQVQTIREVVRSGIGKIRLDTIVTASDDACKNSISGRSVIHSGIKVTGIEKGINILLRPSKYLKKGARE